MVRRANSYYVGIYRGGGLTSPVAKQWGRQATTEWQREWTLALHETRPELTATDLQRMTNREFDIRVSADTVRSWIRKQEQK